MKQLRNSLKMDSCLVSGNVYHPWSHWSSEGCAARGLVKGGYDSELLDFGVALAVQSARLQLQQGSKHECGCLL